MSEYHIPVLLRESVDALEIKDGGIYVDATLGGGGHTREILSRMGPSSTLVVFDQDSDAIENAPKDSRIITVHNNFRFIANFIRYHKIEKVDGILADLGVSSHQFDTPERGFSFRFEAPLDMRMNNTGGIGAAEILNNYPVEELTHIFKEYGEIEKSRAIAVQICSVRQSRRIITTTDLNNAVEKFLPANAEHKFLAKLYQALRIEVNGEMRTLEMFLKGACKTLAKGGIMSIITYHSLEDRIVKNFFKSGNADGKSESDIYGRKDSPFELVNRKPILPDEQEISMNTRARSAKLRIARKL
ncbi:MAG: 16S rRNA (cytosine(1402)-N(4))-methyltransferase RsmH [Candidatus Coprenecus sp.]